MLLSLVPVSQPDEPFLLKVYASTRAEEMAVVPWSEEQKTGFLQMQFKAQSEHYRNSYPNAAFSIIRLENEPVGRLYTADLTDKIKILDVTVLPEFRRKGIGSRLISDILERGAAQQKSVQIYLESFNPSASLFSRLGFQPVAEEGFYHLWQWNAPAQTTHGEPRRPLNAE